MRLAFYGDDFTGATDTLATLARGGMRTVLFLRPPTAAQREAAGPLDCLGIAGAARSMSNDGQRAELEAIGDFMAHLEAPICHYKTCSTFDSAPEVGSIGLAVRVLRERLTVDRFMPVVGGQPNLGRYCVFGHLFAAFKTGAEVFRLDRHPTMRHHPVTPMGESDLRRHLARQGLASLSMIPYPEYALPPAALETVVDQAIAASPDGVLFDVGAPAHLPVVGRIIGQRARRNPILAVGPSSVEQALLAYWQTEGSDQPAGATSADDSIRAGHPARAGRVTTADDSAITESDTTTLGGTLRGCGTALVLSGSLSPRTSRQIERAQSYQHVPLSVAMLVGDDMAGLERAQDTLGRGLERGTPMLAHIVDTRGSHTGAGKRADPVRLAQAAGQLLARVLRRVRPGRIGLAGGDTSSHGIQALEVWGLSYLAPLDPGVALCRLHSDTPVLDGLEVMLKGGQMGSDDLFEKLLGRD